MIYMGTMVRRRYRAKQKALNNESSFVHLFVNVVQELFSYSYSFAGSLPAHESRVVHMSVMSPRQLS